MASSSSWQEDEEQDQESQENFLESQPGDNNYLLGFVEANVVGLQYYQGRIGGREMVRLVREPTNQYDPNAIKVLNMGGQQVGHIERAVALKLAPHLDSRLIIVEGIVPSSSKYARFRIPCQVYVFTVPELRDSVLQKLLSVGLRIVTNSDHDFMTAESAAVKELGGGETSEKAEQKRIDKVFAEIVSQDKRLSKRMEAADIVTSQLLGHQKEALAWMVEVENSSNLPPFWKEGLEDGKNVLVYQNLLTNFKMDQRPMPLRGGILADDMGLGKTLTLLSLIATNRPGVPLPPILHSSVSNENAPDNLNSNSNSSSRENSNSSSSRSKRKRDELSKRVLKKKVAPTLDSFVEHYDPPRADGPKATLVVCPPSVISNWIDQLEQHTKKGSLKVSLYHGSDRIADARKLAKFDIVLTTYNTLASEINDEKSPMKKIEWLRVVLDEAHFVKNVSAKQAKAAKALKADRRWAITGTPIQNSASDLFGIISFLNFQPFSIKAYWNSLIQRPLDRRTNNANARLQGLMGAIALRRMKNTEINGTRMIELPPKNIRIHYVELSTEERNFYNTIEQAGQDVISSFISSGTISSHYSSVLQIILRLRQICDDLSMCPGDFEKLISSFKLEEASSKPDLLKKLLTILQDGGDDFDCPVCLSPPAEPIITICSHVFCKKCIEKIVRSMTSRCPLCRRNLAVSDIFSAPKVLDENELEHSELEKVSSKVSSLIGLLKECRADDPTKKIVIFSQFVKMLNRLQGPLESAGFKFVRLDGSVPTKKRAALIAEFSSTKLDSPTILLASLKAAGVGLNLTAASNVFLLDPWWNPAAEDQAMDRIHRIGQKNPVNVTRLIVKDSIEDRILTLQERKRTIAASAFKYSKEQQGQMRTEDIQHLMQL